MTSIMFNFLDLVVTSQLFVVEETGENDHITTRHSHVPRPGFEPGHSVVTA